MQIVAKNILQYLRCISALTVHVMMALHICYRVKPSEESCLGVKKTKKQPKNQTIPKVKLIF